MQFSIFQIENSLNKYKDAWKGLFLNRHRYTQNSVNRSDAIKKI